MNKTFFINLTFFTSKSIPTGYLNKYIYTNKILKYDLPTKIDNVKSKSFTVLQTR